MADRTPIRPQDVDRHCREIDRCNQRGGRMLSIVDLLDAGTVTVELAGYLLAAISRGSSFMVGALPGGAGKTTVMGALLNFVPADVELVPADSDAVVREARHDQTPRRCYICHEIGAGHYYAYLWGAVLTDLLRLPSCEHMAATNLHADTIDQARDQLCGQNAVPAEVFDAFGLMVFMDVRGRWGSARRRIAAVHEPGSSGPPRLVYGMNGAGGIVPAEPSRLVGADELAHAIDRMEALRAAGARTIEEVRQFLVQV
jgi:hypothetical protein